MILNLDDIKRTLITVFSERLDLVEKLVWANQDFHQLPRPMGTLNITPGLRKVGLNDNQKMSNTGVLSLVGVREFTLSFNCYGEKSMERVSSVSSIIELPSVIAAFREAGMVTVDVQAPVDLTSRKNNQFESRFQVDINFRTTLEITDDIGYIEKVGLSNLINNSTVEL